MSSKNLELDRYDPAPMYPDLKVQTKIRLEQAEAGRSPALLALRYRYGGFAYPPGILYGVFAGEIKENRILRGILYIQIEAYSDIQDYANKTNERWKILM